MDDESLIKYYYEELIMSLITMTLPAEEQKYMIGIGCVGDEILEDYDIFYVMRRQIYIDNTIFDEDQIRVLDEFNNFLEKYSGHDENFYWDVEELKNNTLWKELRQEAGKVISTVFGKKYKIEIERKLIDGIEHTKRKLIDIVIEKGIRP